MTDFAPPRGAWPGTPLIKLRALMIFVGIVPPEVPKAVFFPFLGYCFDG